MSNLSETGTEAFDYFVSLVDDPAARCKIETLLLDVERESFDMGYDSGYEEGEQVGSEIAGDEPRWDEGYTQGWDEGYAEGLEKIGGS